MLTSGQSDFLNLSRFMAALIVVLGHVRSALYPPFADYPIHTLFSKAFYFITGFGHEAVMVFFVISGFLVGGKAPDAYQHDVFKWEGYILDRVTRIYIVFLPALVFGVCADVFGLQYFGVPLYTQGQDLGIAILPRNIEQSISVEIFFANLMMLQTISVTTLGSNGPLWSLANEFWYYLLFPVMLSIFYSRGIKRWIYGIIGISMIVYLPTPIIVLFGVWLLGISVYNKAESNIPIVFGFFIFAIALIAVRFDLFATLAIPYLSEYLVGASFSILLLAFNKITQPLLFSKSAKFFANFSYSLYLTHFPVLILVAAILHSIGIGALYPPTLMTAVIFCGLIVGLVLISYLFSLVTERHTGHLRAILHSGVKWFLIKCGSSRI